MVIKQLGLEGSRAVATPGVKEDDNKTMKEDSKTPEAVYVGSLHPLDSPGNYVILTAPF